MFASNTSGDKMLLMVDKVEFGQWLSSERAGVPYQSPHKLRHGHVIYALKQAKTMTEFKAISQNIMHSSITITDQVYGAFTGDDVKNIIANLGATQPEIGDQLAEMLALLKRQLGP